MPVQSFTKTGAKASTAAQLDKTVFSLDVKNHQLVKDAYLAYLANKRSNLAKTKLRGEVQGGGAKPHRQKGTGRARAGSIRSPLWRGGGITFGPTGIENYSRRMSTSAKRQAIRQALSMANAAGKLRIIEDVEVVDGKTNSAAKLLKKLGVDGGALIVSSQAKPSTKLALRNLSGTNLVDAKYLSVFHIMNADAIVITKPALAVIKDWLGKGAGNE